LLIAAGLASTGHAAAKDPVVARVLDRDIRLAEAEDLNSAIFSTLLDKYATEHGVTATPDEIDVYIARARERRNQRHIQDVAERDAVLAQIEAGGLSDEARKSLEEKLAMYDLFLRTDRQMDEYEAAHPVESRKSGEDLAATTIKAWKLNQVLFKKYGGRVIFQQAGPEPLDAYREFLREAEREGSFKISDPAHAASFWNYFTNDMIHTFLPADDAARVVETPWWMMDRPLGE
ncbi:MAG TPA: hypothetical protein VIH35_01670, partial [Kiritimatiellia bacterium]